MPGYHNERMAKDIYRELTDILREVKDPRVDPMLTLVRVELSGDGSCCKVYVSSLHGMETARASVKGLKSASGFIRRELFSRIRMRKSPELRFIADNSMERGARVMEILDEMHREAGHEPD